MSTIATMAAIPGTRPISPKSPKTSNIATETRNYNPTPLLRFVVDLLFNDVDLPLNHVLVKPIGHNVTL